MAGAALDERRRSRQSYPRNGLSFLSRTENRIFHFPPTSEIDRKVFFPRSFPCAETNDGHSKEGTPLTYFLSKRYSSIARRLFPIIWQLRLTHPGPISFLRSASDDGTNSLAQGPIVQKESPTLEKRCCKYRVGKEKKEILSNFGFPIKEVEDQVLEENGRINIPPSPL